MQLLYTDEVNTDPAAADFFVYAGISVPGEAAGTLSHDIDQLRAKFGYRPEDILKFSTAERAAHITPEQHRDLKREVVAAAAGLGVNLFSSFVLHDLATSVEEARRNEINRICFHFDCHLRRAKDYGVVLIDTFQDRWLSRILREKFSVGLRGLPFTDPYRLDRCLGFHLATIGSSNFCSVIDIVLGSLRYAVNERANDAKRDVVRTLLSQLSPLCIRTMGGKVDELSLFFSPKVVKAAKYLQKYKALHAFLADAGLEAAQVPTDQYW